MSDKTKKLCFVVGPIGSPGEEINNHANFVLEFIIKPVMADFPDYRVVRQDENTTPGMIDSQIIVALRDADLVIADLSHLNPNAFYEIGIRHMVSKPIIHMQLADQRIPFDLSLYKTVKFSQVNPAAFEAARAALKAQVTEAIAEGHEPDNPVTRALGQQHLKQTASPELKVVSDTLESLTRRIVALEGAPSAIAGSSNRPKRGRVIVQTSAKSRDDYVPIEYEIVKLFPGQIGAMSWRGSTIQIAFSPFPDLKHIEKLLSIKGVDQFSIGDVSQADLF